MNPDTNGMEKLSSVPVLLSKNSAAVANRAVKQTANTEAAGKKKRTTKTAVTKNAAVPSTDFPLEKRKVPKNLPTNAAQVSAVNTMLIAAAALCEKQTEMKSAADRM